MVSKPGFYCAWLERSSLRWAIPLASATVQILSERACRRCRGTSSSRVSSSFSLGCSGLSSPDLMRRRCAFLGDISCGLYLVHVMIFVRYDDLCRLIAHGSLQQALQQPIPRLLLCAGVSVLLAWFSRRVYEERFLRMARASSESNVPEEAVK